jgi:acetolactate synthase-1/2/3 large subunit
MCRLTQASFVTTWGLAGNPIERLDGWIGRIGVSGMRGANIATMKSDLVVVIGARLGQSVAGANLDDFCPSAKKFVFDVDRNEIDLLTSKMPYAKTINCDAQDAVDFLVKNLRPKQAKASRVSATKTLKAMNIDEYKDAKNSSNRFDLYRFLIDLDAFLAAGLFPEMNIVIDGGGNIVYSSMQTIMSHSGVNLVIPAGAAPMGTGLPQALGAWSFNKSPTLMLTGDGSLMLNIQEIQTLVTECVDVKIFVFENQGYRSIRSTQQQFLDSRFLGSHSSGGLDLPDLERLALGFGIPHEKIAPGADLQKVFLKGLSTTGPQIYEIPVLTDQEIYPRVRFEQIQGSNARQAMPLDDMHPPLMTT